MARITLPVHIPNLTITNVNAATYDVLITDEVLHVAYTSTGAVTNLRLMSSLCVNGNSIIIKDSGGNAGANPITITTEGTEKIDGQDTYIINSNYGSITLYCYSSNWYII